MKTLNPKINEIVLVFAISATILTSCAGPMSETIYDESAGINGSFEIVKSGLPVNWLLFTPKTVETGDFDLIIDSSVYKEGKQSLNFVVRECSNRGEWNSPGFCKEYDVIPGESYIISFWVKNNGSEFFVKIGGVSAFEGKYETIVKSNEKIDSWKYFEYKYTMPTEEKFNRLRFAMNVLSMGSFWIDDINIVGSNGKNVKPTSR